MAADEVKLFDAQSGKPYMLPRANAQKALDSGKFLLDAPKPAKEVSKTESALRGAAQGATLGFGDELAAGAGALAQKALTRDPESLGQLYTRFRNEERGENEAAQKANPKTFMAGELAGGAPAAIATGGQGVGSGAAQVLRGAAQGAGYGTANALGKTPELNQQAAVDVAKGAALGGGLGGAAGALGAGAAQAAPRLAQAGLNLKTPDVEALGGSEAVKPAMQQMLKTPELTGGLRGLSATAKNVGARAEQLLRQTGTAMQSMYRAGDAQSPGGVPQAQLEQAVLAATAPATRLKPSWQSHVNEILRIVREGGGAGHAPNQPLNMEKLQMVANDLRKLGAHSSPHPTEKLALDKDIYTPAQQAVIGALEQRIQQAFSPADAQQLMKLRQQYGFAKRLHEATSGAANRQAGHNMLGMNDVLAGAGPAIAGVMSQGHVSPAALGTGAIAGMTAAAGSAAARNVLPPMAGKLAQSASAAAGPIAGMAGQAAGNATPVPHPAPQLPKAKEPPHAEQLMSYQPLFQGKTPEKKAQTDFLLQEQDPKYRQAVQKNKENEERNRNK